MNEGKRKKRRIAWRITPAYRQAGFRAGVERRNARMRKERGNNK